MRRHKLRQHTRAQYQRRDSLSSTTSTKSDKPGYSYTPMLTAKSKKKRRERAKNQSRSGSQPAHAMKADLPVWGLSKSAQQHQQAQHHFVQVDGHPARQGQG